MSEQDDNPKEPIPEATESTPEAALPPAVASRQSSVDDAEPVKSETTVAAKSSDGLARGLALLLWLLLIAAAAGAWYRLWPLLLEREARLNSIESQMRTVDGEARELIEQQSGKVEQRLRALEQQVMAETAAQRTGISAIERSLDDDLRRFDERFLRLEERLSRLTATDRRAWLLQEALFMVRLAGQRLAAAQDTDSAQALLRTADDLLREAEDPLLDAARRALAVDLVALRSAEMPDTVGIDARLEALITESDQLQVVEEEADEPEAIQDDWLAQAKAGWRAALAKLSDYLIIRQRATDVASLLTPEWQVLARQNLRMLFEQAQIALLSGNERLYQRALTRARRFAALFAEADPARVDAIMSEIDALSVEVVAPELPDLLDTRRALADAARQLGGGGEG
jgi:uncharacterized protein HemX